MTETTDATDTTTLPAGLLAPLRIGPLRVEFPVVLAALAGYSDLPYRLICRQRGAQYATTEMMLDRMLLTPGRLKHRMLQLDPADHPVAGQLIGNDPAIMAQAAVELSRMGFDVIDLNFACPVRKALSRRRGGYMMSQPDAALDIIRAVVAATDRPVTLKLRKSFRQDDSDCSAFWQIAEGGFEAGVAAITLHARSVEAKYTGPADWEFLARAKQHFPDRTILGSGDVLQPADALKMMAECGVDGVTAARGAMGNPWFFRQVADLLAGNEPYHPPLAVQRRLLSEHFAAACEFYGAKGPRIMRGFGIRYASRHPHPKAVRVAFVNVKKPADWHAVLEEHYGPSDE